jgi:hypothetical protein
MVVLRRLDMFYQRLITQILRKLARADIDARHVEAWMRLQHGTLDALSPRAFATEVRVCVECVDEAGIDRSDELARSYGLMGFA